MEDDVPVQTFSAEQTKEAFDVARNSIELLTTVLSSSPEQDALKVFILVLQFPAFFSLVDGSKLGESILKSLLSLIKVDFE